MNDYWLAWAAANAFALCCAFRAGISYGRCEGKWQKLHERIPPQYGYQPIDREPGRKRIPPQGGSGTAPPLPRGGSSTGRN